MTPYATFLDYIAKSAELPRMAPAQGPPAWELEVGLARYYPVAQLKLVFHFNQTLGW